MTLKTASTQELVQELRSRPLAVIIWQPDDMEGFGSSDDSPESRLAECRKALEGRSIEHGWAVIEDILGYCGA